MIQWSWETSYSDVLQFHSFHPIPMSLALISPIFRPKILKISSCRSPPRDPPEVYLKARNGAIGGTSGFVWDSCSTQLRVWTRGPRMLAGKVLMKTSYRPSSHSVQVLITQFLMAAHKSSKKWCFWIGHRWTGEFCNSNIFQPEISRPFRASTKVFEISPKRICRSIPKQVSTCDGFFWALGQQSVICLGVWDAKRIHKIAENEPNIGFVPFHSSFSASWYSVCKGIWNSPTYRFTCLCYVEFCNFFRAPATIAPGAWQKKGTWLKDYASYKTFRKV